MRCPHCQNEDESLMAEVLKSKDGSVLMECINCSKMFRVKPKEKV